MSSVDAAICAPKTLKGFGLIQLVRNACEEFYLVGQAEGWFSDSIHPGVKYLFFGGPRL